MLLAHAVHEYLELTADAGLEALAAERPLHAHQLALPTPRDLETAHLFPHDTYKAVLFGKGFYEGKRLSRAATLSEAHWREFGKMIDGRRDELMHELPDHRTLLDFKRGEQAPPQPTALMMKPAKTQPARPRRAPVFAPTSGSLL